MKRYSRVLTYLVAVLLLVLAVRVGLKLPDIDGKLWFLKHRSLLTHGLLLPLLLFCLARPYLNPVPRLFVIGLSLSMAVHLCFDLFPKAWSGFALIKVPLYGQTGALFSWLWIATSCVVCVYLALLLIQYVFELLLGAASLLMAFIQHVQQNPYEHHASALMALLIAAALALTLPSNAGSMLRQQKRNPDSHHQLDTDAQSRPKVC